MKKIILAAGVMIAVSSQAGLLLEVDFNGPASGAVTEAAVVASSAQNVNITLGEGIADVTLELAGPIKNTDVWNNGNWMNAPGEWYDAKNGGAWRWEFQNVAYDAGVSASDFTIERVEIDFAAVTGGSGNLHVFYNKAGTGQTELADVAVTAGTMSVDIVDYNLGDALVNDQTLGFQIYDGGTALVTEIEAFRVYGIPEPGTLSLFAIAGGVMIFIRRKMSL